MSGSKYFLGRLDMPGKLLMRHRSKTRQGAMNDGGKDLAQKPGIDHDADKTT